VCLRLTASLHSGSHDTRLAYQYEAIRRGQGIGALPCYLGDSDPDLIRLTPPHRDLECDLWILVHLDVRDAPRISALAEPLFNQLKKQETLLTGISLKDS
jgi:DNA-binding transcriptional LysR family regulator